LIADCIEAMPGIATGSVALVVTSAPYNAGKEYETELSLDEYERRAEEWISCIPRLLAPDGALWLNVGYTKLSEAQALPLTYFYYPIIRKHGLHLIQEVVWQYEGGMAYTRRFSHRTERWMWVVKDPTNYVFHLDDIRDGTLNLTVDRRNNDHGKNPTDLRYFDRVVGGKGAGREKTLHPCQTPVAMLERIVRACSNPGDVVLDPFGGVGSTAVAAYQNARGFISIERDARYHEISEARLASTVAESQSVNPRARERHPASVKGSGAGP
jgi:adenine-specific DNA-methyltransferase